MEKEREPVGSDGEAAGAATSDSGRRSVQLLAKVGEILTVLGEHESLGATEIAQRIEEPRSSVYRLLRTLRQLGYVDSRRRGQFSLGLRVFQLGSAVAERFNVREATRAPMARVHEATEATVLLFVRRGAEATCVERLDGRWVRLEIVDVGEALPLHAGAAPRTLLAYCDDDFVDRYLEATRLEQHTERSPTTPREVRLLLEEIRRQGFAVSDEDLVLGVASIAAPIRNHTGAVVAAMSCSGIATTLLGADGAERDRTAQLVVEGAREASRRLGWSADVHEPAAATVAG